jgi:FixJ family two-component response regulator
MLNTEFASAAYAQDGQSHGPLVLLVGDDAACLGDYAATLAALGQAHRIAETPDRAIDILTEDERIGILLTDAGMHGVQLIKTIADRISQHRLIIPVFIADVADADLVVETMRLGVADFLRKPVTRADLSSAMARARTIWSQRQQSGDPATLTMLSEQITGLVAALEQARSITAPQGSQRPSSVQRQIERYIANQRKRAQHFPDQALCETSWKILLDLALAHLKGKPVAVSSACIASEAPVSTALRRIRELCDAGLLVRWPDPTDGRRDMLSLSDECFRSMEAYFTQHYQEA